MLALAPENLKIRHEASYTEGQQNTLELARRYVESAVIASSLVLLCSIPLALSVNSGFWFFVISCYLVFAAMTEVSVKLDKAITKKAQLYRQQITYSVEIPTLDQLRQEFATMESDDGYE